MPTSARNEVTILIVEDDDGHAELIRENLQEVGLGNSIIRFSDGLEAWGFLSRQGPEPHRIEPQAYLILLDIRMPKMGGVELLKRIKSDPALHAIPVIMLTTTNDPREIEECYQLGCNSYVTKPINYLQFMETLKRLGLFIMIVQIAPVNGGN